MSIHEEQAKQPHHLVQISRVFNDKESIAVSMYFDDPSTIDTLLTEARKGLDNHDKDFQKRLDAAAERQRKLMEERQAEGKK